MEIEDKRVRLICFVSIIVLLIFAFCYATWAILCDVTFSDYYEWCRLM